jgi:hypothetical protein
MNVTGIALAPSFTPFANNVLVLGSLVLLRTPRKR